MNGDAEPLEVRLSDADRDAVVKRLSSAMGDGRLDVTEFEERSRKAYAAKVPSDLGGLVEDLPPLPEIAPPISATAPAVRAPNPVAAPNTSRRWIVSLFGDRRKGGAWNADEQTIALTLFGDQTLDFTAAEASEVRVLSCTMFGDVKIVVPAGARLDFSGFSLFGDVADDAVGAPTPDGPVIRVRRYALFGDVKLKIGDSS